MAKKVTQPCTRCGGAGGWTGWPGFTCFRCGGSGVDPTLVWDRTPEEEAKLQQRRERRDAKRHADSLAAKSAFNQEHPRFAQCLAEYVVFREKDEPRPIHPSEFIWDIAQRFARDGSLTDKQADAFVNAWESFKVKLAERQRERDALLPVAEAQGVILEGVVVKAWYDEESDFPGWRMTLKVDAGNIYRGTLPQRIRDSVLANDNVRVSLVADVSPSKKDATIGYFKRPRSAWVTSEIGEQS